MEGQTFNAQLMAVIADGKKARQERDHARQIARDALNELQRLRQERDDAQQVARDALNELQRLRDAMDAERKGQGARGF